MTKLKQESNSEPDWNIIKNTIFKVLNSSPENAIYISHHIKHVLPIYREAAALLFQAFSDAFQFKFIIESRETNYSSLYCLRLTQELGVVFWRVAQNTRTTSNFVFRPWDRVSIRYVLIFSSSFAKFRENWILVYMRWILGVGRKAETTISEIYGRSSENSSGSRLSRKYNIFPGNVISNIK